MENAVADNNYMINDLAEKSEDFYAGKIIGYKQDGNNFEFEADNEVVMRVYVLTDKIIRFRFSVDGYFTDDFSYAFEQPFQADVDELEFKEKPDHYRITTKRVILTVYKDGMRTKIMDKSGTVLLEDEKGFHWENNLHKGGEIVMMSKKLQPKEYFYGLGDKSCRMNLRERRLEMWGSDTYGYGRTSDPLYKNIPFYYGMHHNAAYGVFFDNTFRSFFDFGHERSNVTSFWAQGGEMDYYFYYGPTLMEVAKNYVRMTGTPEMPPLWALGYHQCKWSYYPESKVKEITDGFRDRKIPCDAIYLDIDYMDGFRCFTWNKEYFEDPQRMVKELAKDGFKTIVIIDPGIKIDKKYWVYQEAIEKDYFCKRGDGPLMKGTVWPGECNFPDFTNPEVREWWAGLFKGLIAEDGIKGVWNDMNEPAVFEMGTFPEDVRHDYDGHPCSHRKAHNIYGMQMARATYNGVKQFSYPNRPFTITRSGYSGMQRYSSGWTGDNVASWEHLWIANVQCLRLAVSGLSFIGTDIGGFIETPDGELYTRWLQLGIFHPFCRTHSSGDHGDQEPWSFGEEYTDLARKFIELRYKLLPYIYHTFKQYVEEGAPMLRPLPFVYQYDPETHYRQDEFLFGDRMLVCPVLQADADGRWMYLPEGAWYNYWTDEKLAGSNEVWADAPLDIVPMFIQAGTVLPHFPAMQYVGEKVIKEVDMHVYFGIGEHENSWYDDKGDGYEYENGEFRRAAFKSVADVTKMELNQTIDGTYQAPYATYKLFIHGLPFEAKTAQVDGQDVKLTPGLSESGNAVYTAKVPADFKKLELAE